MITEKKHQHQSQSAEQKIFERIYNRKFVNQASSALTERRRIVASQLKPKKDEDAEGSDGKINERGLKKKSKSIGSLLPQIKEIEVIARSEKSVQSKPRTNSLSKLQIYLSQKNIKKTEQLNILFLTQSLAVVPDRIFNEKFNNFVAVSQENQPKNLRALLSLTGGFQASQEFKLTKIGQQKEELTEIVKTMIEQHHANEEIKAKENSQKENQQEEELEEEEEEVQVVQGSPSRSIDWVLKECKKYDKKFRLKKKKKKSKKSNSILKPQS